MSMSKSKRHTVYRGCFALADASLVVKATLSAPVSLV
jgi:hypothetical protein